jgi:lysine/ornithine N-monooxygenase
MHRRISVRRINGDNLQAIYDAIFAHHWIMDHLNYRMMPTDQMMQMQRRGSEHKFSPEARQRTWVK